METIQQARSVARLRTGVEVRYMEQGPREASEVILLLHGWPDSSFSFSRVLPALAPDRYRAVAIDQRGFGESERPASGYAIDDLAADAVAFLDALGIAEATVVGHSMGSFVARRVAELHPLRVRRLALIGSAISANNEVLREVAELVREVSEPVPVDFTREFQAGTLYAPVPEAFFDALVAESRKAPARVWRNVIDGVLAFDDASQPRDITAPTLVLGGEHDALFSVAEQTALAAAIPGARLTLYPDTGHCPNWERPERVAADLDTFIRQTRRQIYGVSDVHDARPAGHLRRRHPDRILDQRGRAAAGAGARRHGGSHDAGPGRAAA